ncbi:hypothetical protein NRP93_003602 [Clostridium botulinum]|nr:hypothetical protein [Clostridium botulinum]
MVNDEACSAIFKYSAEEIVGKNNVSILEKDNFGEKDFYHYSKKVKSVYFFVGCALKDKAGSFSLHSLDFCIDERILACVAAILANATICFLVFNLKGVGK